MWLEVLDTLFEHFKVTLALAVAPCLCQGIDNVDLVGHGRIVMLEDGEKGLPQEVVIFTQQDLCGRGCCTNAKMHDTVRLGMYKLGITTSWLRDEVRARRGG